MKIKKLPITMLLTVVSCAALLNGCGSSSKEGTTGGVGLVDEGTCIVCHSPTTDPVSGTHIVTDYATSIHNPANTPANTTINAGNPDGCQGCHGGGAEHNGVGPIPFPDPLSINTSTGQTQCQACHLTATTALFTTELPNEDFAGTCGYCHTGTTSTSTSGTGIGPGIGIHGANLPNRDDCVGCHSVGRNAPPHRSDQIVQDNSGVRAITGTNGEFGDSSRTNVMGYRSHHIYNGTGLDPQNAQCIACHLEGKVIAGRTVVTNPVYHMADGNIHLRDGNSNLTYPESSAVHTAGPDGQSEFIWNPASPNHQIMDQFCMSCHNSSGAVTAYANMSSALYGMTAIAGAQPLSQKNPFGDQLTNAYDQRVRPAVVDVYDQMNPSNSSHHAVRGQRYSGRTRYAAAGPTTRGVVSQTPFTQYSGAGNARIHPNANGVLTAYQLFGTYSSTSAPASGTGPRYPGSRTTMYDAGLFVANYTTLNGQTLGDDSSLHCGDCHSVGQWKPGSANAISWGGVATATSPNSFTVQATTAVIGAHGAQNEYMLRTSDGSDSLQIQSTTGASNGASSAVNGTYVCFLCHTQYYYGNNSAVAQSNVVYGTNAVRGDFGHGGGIGPCNGILYSGYGKIGTARYGVLVNGTATPSIGNIFAMSCAHCHNSGQQNYGGIHGAVGTYLSYSTNGTDVAGNTVADAQGSQAAAYQINVTHKTSYRFMGGESNRYNGGATADKWESQTPSKLHREGCYNLSSTPNQSHLWNTATPMQVGPNGTPGPWSDPAIQNNGGSDSAWGVSDYTTSLNGRYGQNNATSGWGSCNHHQGSTTVGPTAPTRVIQRPLVY